MHLPRYIQNLLSLCVLFLLTQNVFSMTDKATGIPFPSDLKEGLNLFGVGVRRKGPIRVYSVGMYCNSKVRETLKNFSRTADKGKEALAALCKGAEENPTSFVLKMNFKVGAEKMASAIAESVAPRHSVSSEVDDLKGLIFSGVSVKGAAVKGTEIKFDCCPEKGEEEDEEAGVVGVSVSVDGKEQGNVPSTGLAKALCQVYLDDKCVSQQLRDSILENCCDP